MNLKDTLNKFIDAINIKSDIFGNIAIEIDKIRNVAKEIPNTIINPITADSFYPLCVSNMDIIKSLMKHNPVGLHKFQSSKEEIPLHTIEEQIISYINEHTLSKQKEMDIEQKTIDSNDQTIKHQHNI